MEVGESTHYKLNERRKVGVTEVKSRTFKGATEDGAPETCTIGVTK